jgi:hypothetical protein
VTARWATFHQLEPDARRISQVNSVVVVMTDITDAVLLQAKLAHSEKMATIGRPAWRMKSAIHWRRF